MSTSIEVTKVIDEIDRLIELHFPNVSESMFSRIETLCVDSYLYGFRNGSSITREEMLRAIKA